MFLEQIATYYTNSTNNSPISSRNRDLEAPISTLFYLTIDE